MAHDDYTLDLLKGADLPWEFMQEIHTAAVEILRNRHPKRGFTFMRADVDELAHAVRQKCLRVIEGVKLGTDESFAAADGEIIEIVAYGYLLFLYRHPERWVSVVSPKVKKENA